MTAGILLLVFSALVLAPAAQAQTPDCGAAGPAVETVPLPAHPFAAIPSADGCTIYVSLLGKGERGKGAVAALRRENGAPHVLASVEVDPAPTEMVLSHDGALLIAASGDGAAIFDTAKLASGSGDSLIGRIHEGGTDAINVALTQDDRFLFIADEHSADISVIDFAKARAGDFSSDALIGQIPTGRAPIALVFSHDGSILYTTSEIAPFPGWPRGCKAETQQQMDDHPQGAVIVIDVASAEATPRRARIRPVPAGCSPVRLTLSADGTRLYATARNDDAVLVFDTAKLLSGASDARIATIPVGNSPVGIALVQDGKKLVVTNSARYSANRTNDQSLSVIDTATLAVTGSIPAGSFPRELAVTPDGKTLLVTNFGSNSLMLIDSARALP